MRLFGSSIPRAIVLFLIRETSLTILTTLALVK
jgi:hypothetical protein